MQSQLNVSELNLHIIDLPQFESFQSAVGVRNSRRAMIVEAIDQDGNAGYGECSARPDPYYSAEFLDACVQLIQGFIAPIFQQEDLTFADFYQQLGKIRGWNFTKNAVMDALLNMREAAGEANPVSDESLSRIDRIPVGISLGIYSSPEILLQKVDEALADGYRRIKLKVSPQSDITQFETIKQHFPDLALLLDANGSFGEDDFDYLAKLQALELSAIEQPFPPDRLDLCQKMRKALPDLRICLDESVDDYGHLLSAMQMDALDELNIKIGRVGGLFEALHLNEVCQQNGIATWVGGMFESGVGRTNNLRFAALLVDAKAHDLSPSSRYFPEDIIQSPIVMAETGDVILPEAPPMVDLNILEKYRIAEHRLLGENV